jgi:hypothetical protein
VVDVGVVLVGVADVVGADVDDVAAVDDDVEVDVDD